MRGDYRSWLGGQGELELVEQQYEFGFRLSVAGEQQFAAIGGRHVEVDHLHGGELLDGAPWRQAGRQGLQSPSQGDVQAVGQEGDEDVRLDAALELMEQRPDGEVALQVFEGLLDADELKIQTQVA